MIELNELDYQAVFLPEQGMTLVSFKRNQIEVIDQSTKKEFDERNSGLGPLIGPHFYRRKKEIIPRIEDETRFPQIERMRKRNIEDPFSHGIARYAPWKVVSTSQKHVHAKLSGKDEWNGVALSKLEGQNFVMEMKAELTGKGLQVFLSVVSDTDSIVGIHYYYRLPPGNNWVNSEVAKFCYQDRKLTPIPKEWGYDGRKLEFTLNQFADYTFFPKPDPLKAEIWLNTEEYALKTSYECVCQENSWQLYHPKDASFVCIEPTSSQDPRHPNLSVSSLTIHLQVEPKILEPIAPQQI